MLKKLKKKIPEKGLAMTFVSIITVLLFMGLFIAIVVMSISRYISVHEIVQESAVDRHALNLGQVLLSHPRLVYQDGNYLYRGIFEKEKIDEQIIEFYGWGNTEITEEVAYPNSIIIIGVMDFVTEDSWAMKYRGPLDSATSGASLYIQCVYQRISEDVKDLSILFKKPKIWADYDIKECAEVAKSNYGTETRVFPVIIKDGDEMHPGALYVTIREARDLGGGANIGVII